MSYKKIVKRKLKSLAEARVVYRKPQSGERVARNQRRVGERVSGSAGRSKPETAPPTPRETVASYKAAQRRSSQTLVTRDGKFRDSGSERQQIAPEQRDEPNRHQRKRMMKEAFSVILERDGLEISGKVHTNDHGVFKGQGQTRGRKRKVVRSRRDADPEVVQGRAFNTKVRIAANQATKNRDTPKKKLP